MRLLIAELWQIRNPNIETLNKSEVINFRNPQKPGKWPLGTLVFVSGFGFRYSDLLNFGFLPKLSYWLELLGEGTKQNIDLEPLNKETNELTAIFVTMIKNAKAR